MTRIKNSERNALIWNYQRMNIISDHEEVIKKLDGLIATAELLEAAEK